ncbi:MAG: hypothetical protein IJY23_00895 [Clostridia bacterium]|nr:hypothetical protein [Clostridia bacterium]
MKKLSKILVLLLSVALVCAGLIIAVSADGSTGTPGAKYIDATTETEQTATDLATAITNAKAGTTVTLTGDTTNSAVISLDKALTLDLGGYTLTSTSGIFYLGGGSNYTFTITGEGTIVTDSYIVSINWGAHEQNRNVNVIGTGKGIDITLNESKAGRLFVIDAGTWTFENLNIKADIYNTSKDKLFYTHYDTSKGAVYPLYMNFKDVTMNVTSESKQSSVIATTLESTATLNNCYIHTDGANVFANASSTNEKYITINNSYLDVASFSGDASGNADGAIFGDGFSTLKTDIVVTNSYLSQVRRSVIKFNENNSALILDNSVLHIKQSSQSKTNAMFRTMNVVLKNGSAITSDIVPTTAMYSDTGNTNYPKVNDTVMASNMVLCEGTRIDANVYKAIITNGLTKGITFTDKSVPGAEGAEYVFVYDPASNPVAPYKVVKESEAENYTAVPYEYDKSYNLPVYTKNVSDALISTLTSYNVETGVWNNITKASYPGGTKTDALQIILGKANNSYPIINTNGETTYGLVITEFDIGTDSADGISAGTMWLHAKQKTGDLWNNGDSNSDKTMTAGPTISSDGTITIGENSIQLDLTKWNHVTVVMDPNAEAVEEGYVGVAYYYVNGDLLGTTKGVEAPATYDGQKSDTTYFYAVTYTYEKSTERTVLFDNLTNRTYAKDTVSYETDPSAYLINEGKPFSDTLDLSNLGMMTNVVYAGDSAAVINYCQTNEIPLKLVDNWQNAIVNINCTIYANGHTLTTGEGSYLANAKYDASENIYSYTFDSSYSEMVVKYKFSTNGEEVECHIGDIPAESFTGTVSNNVAKRDNHWLTGTHIGWTTVEGSDDADGNKPVTIDFAEANTEQVTLYPVYSYKQVLTWVIEDANGEYVDGGETTLFYGTHWTTRSDGAKTAHLYSGQTFVLQKDGVKFAAPVNPKNTASEGGSDTESEVFNFDLNGHLLYSDWRTSGDIISHGVFQPAANDTYNIYSSRQGAQLIDVGGYKNNAYSGGDLFRVNDTENSAINVGKVTVNGVSYPGSNLTINANAIVRLHSNSVATASVNIDGCTLIQGTNTHVDKAVIYSYSGTTAATANIKNATIVLPLGGYLVNNMTNTTTSILFENCTIIAKEDGDNLIKNSKSGGTITFDNCVTNGSIDTDGSKEGTVIVKDTAAVANAYDAPEGYVNAKANIKMTLGEGVESLTVHSISLKDTNTRSTPVYTDFVVSSASLPILTISTILESEAVKVTWNDLDGEILAVEYYVKGMDVTAMEDLTESTGNFAALKKVFTGWDSIPTNIQENTVINPNYEINANLNDLQANVSLYANFGVNLYIPSGYEKYVTVTDSEGNAITPTNITGYLKYTITQLCNKASENVTFTISVKETIGGAEYTDTVTASVSIVSYAKAVLDATTENITDADKVLVYYMLNYANEAAKYINDEEDTAIATLLTNNADVADKYIVSELNENEIIENQNLTGVFTEATIVLKPTPAFAFKLVDGFVGTVKVTYANNITKTIGSDEAIDGWIYVPGMKAYNFGTVLTITAEGTVPAETEGETVTVSVTNGKFSLETYVNGLTDSDAHAALAKALRAYAEVSELYKNQTLDDAIAEQAAA